MTEQSEMYQETLNDRFHGTSLPATVGLRNLLETEYQVVPDRVTPTTRIMLNSAEQAGLFEAAGNRSKMVMPFVEPASPLTPPPLATPEQPEVIRRGGSGGNGGGDGTDIDPAILGLLTHLPPRGTPLSDKRRKVIIDGFSAAVNVIYPEADRQRPIDERPTDCPARDRSGAVLTPTTARAAGGGT